MPVKRPTTIAQYISAAPPLGRPHLRRIYKVLKSAAPKAESLIKWNTPFFIEPRFLFAFSANKGHIGFAPTADTLHHFRDDLAPFKTTKELVHFPYDRPLPEALIRKIARYRVRVVAARDDDGFW